MRCATAGRPSPSGSTRCKAAGCERILLAPLYPQYCAATTATAHRRGLPPSARACAGSRRCARCRLIMTIRPISPRSRRACEAALAALDFEPQALVASFHGMPQRTLELGDPYHCHCRKTARLLVRGARPRARSSPSSRASAAPNGWSRRPTRCSPRCPARASPRSRSSRRASPPIAWRRWRSWRSAAATPSSPRAARDFAYLPCLNDSAPGMAMLRALIAPRA